MTVSAILREAWRDIVTGTVRTVWYTLALALVMLGLGAAEVATVRQITDAAERYQDAGASVVTFSAPGRIDATACDALNTVPGVRAAGALRAGEESVTATALPSSPIPVVHVTPAFPMLLGTTTDGSGIILSDDAASTLSLGAGDELRTADSQMRVAGVYAYPDDGRRPGYGYAALVPTSDSDPFDECWADIWPPSSQAPTLLRTTLLPDGGENLASAPVLTQLNTRLGTSFDGPAQFSGRITRFAPAVGAVAGVVLGFLAVRTRRLPLAANLHTGVTKADLARILAVETFSWTAAAAVLACGAAAVVAARAATDSLVVAVLCARIVLPTALGPFLGGAVALVSTRERHLFTYFKDR